MADELFNVEYNHKLKEFKWQGSITKYAAGKTEITLKLKQKQVGVKQTLKFSASRNQGAGKWFDKPERSFVREGVLPLDWSPKWALWTFETNVTKTAASFNEFRSAAALEAAARRFDPLVSKSTAPPPSPLEKVLPYFAMGLKLDFTKTKTNTDRSWGDDQPVMLKWKMLERVKEQGILDELRSKGIDIRGPAVTAFEVKFVPTSDLPCEVQLTIEGTLANNQVMGAGLFKDCAVNVGVKIKAAFRPSFQWIVALGPHLAKQTRAAFLALLIRYPSLGHFMGWAAAAQQAAVSGASVAGRVAGKAIPFLVKRAPYVGVLWSLWDIGNAIFEGYRAFDAWQEAKEFEKANKLTIAELSRPLRRMTFGLLVAEQVFGWDVKMFDRNGTIQAYQNACAHAGIDAGMEGLRRQAAHSFQANARQYVLRNGLVEMVREDPEQTPEKLYSLSLRAQFYDQPLDLARWVAKELARQGLL